MKPLDLALPVKFSAFRPGQEDMALRIACGEHRFVLLSAPTGCGKSLVYIAAAQLLDARVLILTSTKGLQQQLVADFASAGLRDVRGQNNYPCVALDRGGLLEEYGNPAGCDQGPCHVSVFCPLKKEGGCVYYDAVRVAHHARMVVTNYAYWMTINRFSDPDTLGDFDVIVLDEAHAAPDLLAAFCAVRLERFEVSALIDMTLPPIDEGVAVWVAWAKEAHEVCREKYRETRHMLNGMTVDRRATVKVLRRLAELGRSLQDLSQAGDWKRSEASSPDVWMPGAQTDWIAESTATGLLFSPVWAHAYAEECLFRGTPRVILSSATLQQQTARYLGIGRDEMDFMEFDSTFDPTRRPFIYIPTTRVDHRMTEAAKLKWMQRVDEIIAGRLDRKGIIHTRSYARAREVVERSQHSGIMLTHTNARGVRQAVTEFRRARAPAVLVSPSVEAGYDFPYEECEYQILAKVPFVDSRAPLMKARAAGDKSYLNYITALSVIQQTGRGMRAEDDMCETFIADDHWAWFRRRAKRLFPAWFRRSWVQADTVPEAPTIGRRSATR